MEISGGTDNISANIRLEDSLEITTDVSQSLRLTGVISGTGNLIVTGNMGTNVANNVRLEHDSNSFTGLITVSGSNARLSANADSRLGNAANDIVLKDGGTLMFETSSVLNAQRTITLENGGRILTDQFSSTNRHTTLAGDILGTGGLTLALPNNNGSQILNLAGNNTFTGGLMVHQGQLRFASKESLGADKSLSFGTGGGVGMSIIGSEVNNLSDFTFSYSANTGIVFDIQDAGNEFEWDHDFNVTMNSATATAFTKTGRGTLVVTTEQTYWNSNGGGIVTAVNGGTLKIDYEEGGSLRSGNKVAFQGGNLHLLGSSSQGSAQTFGNIRVGSGGGTLIVESRHADGMTATLGNFSSLAPQPGGALNIRTVDTAGTAVVTTTETNDASGIIGAGRIVFNGSDFATNTTNLSGGEIGAYSGATAGFGDETVGSTVNYSLVGGATLGEAATYANTLKIASSGAGQSLDLNGQTLALTTGGLLFTGTDAYSISNGTLEGAAPGNSDLIIHHYGTGDLTIGAVIDNGNGASTLTKAGTGTLILTNANTYTGQTYVNGGVLSISANDQLSTATLNLNGGTLRVTSGFSTSRGTSLGGSGGTFDIADGETLTLTGAISGNSGSLILNNSGSGTGVLEVNAGNTFGGGVVIESGVLRLGNNGNLNGSGINTLTFGAGSTATLQINGGKNVAVAGLVSSSTNAVVENGASGAAVLRVHNGWDNTYAGVLRDGAAGTLGLIKGGRGTLTLTGTNTYTGATEVHSGKLLVNGSLGGTSVSVSDGAVLGGNGSIAGATTIRSGGRLAPGNSPGLLTEGSDLTLETGSIFEFELLADSTSGRGTIFDGVDVGGTLTIETGVTSQLVFNSTGSTVDFASAFWDSDQSWLVFSSAEVSLSSPIFGSITTTMDSLGASFAVTGGSLSWSQQGTDVYLVYTIPEPGTALLALGALAACSGMFGRNRRRQHA
jgi:fibronectin-binding autotransporter adhesin